MVAVRVQFHQKLLETVVKFREKNKQFFNSSRVNRPGDQWCQRGLCPTAEQNGRGTASR